MTRNAWYTECKNILLFISNIKNGKEMEKTFTHVALCVSFLGMVSTTAVAKIDADSLQNESGVATVVQTNTESQRVEIPVISSGRGDIKVMFLEF